MPPELPTRPSHTADPPRPQGASGVPAGPRVVATAVLVAAWFLVFAVLNIVVALSGRFEHPDLVRYVPGLLAESAIVFVLKLIGATFAIDSVLARPRLPARLRSAVLWAAAGTLGVYAVGNIVQLIGFATGVMGSPALITPTTMSYVAFFIPAATGCCILAVSHTRRYHVSRHTAVAGLLGAPLVLGALLLGIPAALAAVGLMPGY